MQAYISILFTTVTLATASTQYASSSVPKADYTLPVMVSSSNQYPLPHDHLIHPPQNSGYDSGRGQVSYQVSPASNSYQSSSGSNPNSYQASSSSNQGSFQSSSAPSPNSYQVAPATNTGSYQLSSASNPSSNPAPPAPAPATYSSSTSYSSIPASHPEYNIVEPGQAVDPHTDIQSGSSSYGSQNVYANVINSSPPEEDSDEEDDDRDDGQDGAPPLGYSSELYKLVDNAEADMKNCLENGQFLPHPFDDCKYKRCMYDQEPWQGPDGAQLITQVFPCPPGTGVSRIDFNEIVPCSERNDACSVGHHVANRHYDNYN